MKKQLYPPVLQQGDKIAIISPSGAVDANYLDGAANRLKDWGFEVVFGEYAKNKFGRYAGTIEERAKDLQWAVNNPAIKAVLCGRGGYGAIQLIEHIDFTPLLQHPKWLVGFSDITVFHSVLSQLRIPSLHAIMARNLSENAVDDDSVCLLRSVLMGKKPVYTVDGHALNKTGISEGLLTGGNLSVLAGLRATAYDIIPKGRILFLEDIAEKPYHIDRMMRNLRIGGILEQLSGLIIGQFTEIEEDPSLFKTVYEIIADAVAGYNYPVCFNFPAGHITNNLPLIMGGTIKLNVTPEKVQISYNNEKVG